MRKIMVISIALLIEGLFFYAKKKKKLVDKKKKLCYY